MSQAGLRDMDSLDCLLEVNVLIDHRGEESWYLDIQSFNLLLCALDVEVQVHGLTVCTLRPRFVAYIFVSIPK